MKNLVFIFLLIPFLSFGQDINIQVTPDSIIWPDGKVYAQDNDWQTQEGWYSKPYDVDFTYDIKGDTLIITETKYRYNFVSCGVLGCTVDHTPEPEVTKRYYLIEHIFDMKAEKQLVQKMVEERVFKRIN